MLIMQINKNEKKKKMVWLKKGIFFSQAMGVSNYGNSNMLPKYFVHCLAIEKLVTHC